MEDEEASEFAIRYGNTTMQIERLRNATEPTKAEAKKEEKKKK